MHARKRLSSLPLPANGVMRPGKNAATMADGSPKKAGERRLVARWQAGFPHRPVPGRPDFHRAGMTTCFFAISTGIRHGKRPFVSTPWLVLQ